MSYPTDQETKEKADTIERSHPDLDDSVSLNQPDDDQIPRIKGLIELLNQYFSDKPKERV